MPIFTYHCEQCGKDSDILVPRFDADAVCPECGSDKLAKLPSVFSAVTSRGPSSCASRHDCPSAGTHQCGCGCGCGHHHE